MIRALTPNSVPRFESAFRPPSVELPSEGIEVGVGGGAPRGPGQRVDPSQRGNGVREERSRRSEAPGRRTDTERGSRSSEAPGRRESSDAGELSEEEQAEVEDLKQRDAEVRRHEQAHAAAGGAYAGAPRYTYTAGPDGRRYATEGSVSIDVGEVPGDKRASLSKLQTVIRAANAPAQPSGQDRNVAASARAKIARIQAEMSRERAEEAQESAAGPSGEEEEGDAGVALRATEAYRDQAASTEVTEAVGSTVKVLACENCGSAHSAG